MNRVRLMSALFVALFVLTLALAVLPAAALAAPPECPDGFMAMPAGEHHHEGDEHHEDHLHVGLWPDADRNGDGTICVKHIEQGRQHVHVHIDNIAW